MPPGSYTSNIDTHSDFHTDIKRRDGPETGYSYIKGVTVRSAFTGRRIFQDTVRERLSRHKNGESNKRYSQRGDRDGRGYSAQS
jgi:hypothetical protein